MKLGLTAALLTFGLFTNPIAASTSPPTVPMETRLCGESRTRVLDAATQASNHYSLPLNLVMGVIWVESACKPRVVSWAGAVGLMQVMPRETGYQFRDRPTAIQLTVIETNVQWGSYILQDMDARYCQKWHINNPKFALKTESSYWQCALGAFWGGTQVYFSGRLTPNEQAYADMVIGAARRVDITR